MYTHNLWNYVCVLNAVAKPDESPSPAMLSEDEGVVVSVFQHTTCSSYLSLRFWATSIKTI